MTALSAEEFAALLNGLGPFEPAPRLAVAVSGGADSLALALLADTWARALGGNVLALIVDHGLRPESRAEAMLTAQRLAGKGIACHVLQLLGLHAGAGLAARARARRYEALLDACATTGRLHLLLGHHAADQAETVAMRLLAGSGPDGLAAMPALREMPQARLMRPLLTIPAVRLRETLLMSGLEWIDDPSNVNAIAQRARLRAARRDGDGIGPASRALVEAAATRGRARAAKEIRVAACLATRSTLTQYGFALVSGQAISTDALIALLRTVSGSPLPPAAAKVASIAISLRSATLAGVRIMPAGRLLAGGWLLVREAAAVADRIAALPGSRWDGRFHLEVSAQPPDNAEIGALGPAAAALRGWSDLPSSVLQTLPAVWLREKLAVVPQLGYPDRRTAAKCGMRFFPASAAAGVPFMSPSASCQACVIAATG